MADQEEQPTTDEAPATERSEPDRGEVTDVGGAEDTTDHDAADHDEADPQGDDAEATGYEWPSTPEPVTDTGWGNTVVVGVLRIHYPGSTIVEVPMDGYTALRALRHFKEGRRGGGDIIDPEQSSAHNLWAVYSPNALAMTWMPGIPTPEPKVSFDPAMDAA